MARKKAKAALHKLPVRNPVATNPLLSKSAVHEKTTKSRRRRDKVKLKKEWYPQSAGLVVCALRTSFPLQSINLSGYGYERMSGEFL